MKRVPRRQLIVPATAALFAAAFSLISAASAQTFSSSYTSTAPKDCRMRQAADTAARRRCARQTGAGGLAHEDDLRQTVSVGPNRIAATKSRPQRPVCPVQFHRSHRRMAGGGWQAVRDHSALADRRHNDLTRREPRLRSRARRDAAAPGPVPAPISTARPPQRQQLARRAADEFARDLMREGRSEGGWRKGHGREPCQALIKPATRRVFAVLTSKLQA